MAAVKYPDDEGLSRPSGGAWIETGGLRVRLWDRLNRAPPGARGLKPNTLDHPTSLMQIAPLRGRVD